MSRRANWAVGAAVLVLAAGCARGPVREQAVRTGEGVIPTELPEVPGIQLPELPALPEVPGVELPELPGITGPPEPQPGDPSTQPGSPGPPTDEQAEPSSPQPASGPSECGPLTMFALANKGGAPAGVAPGDGGSVWFTDPKTSSIGRLKRDGNVTRYKLRSGSKPGAIARGPGGNLWYVDPAGPSIGRITPAGAVKEFPLPTVEQNSMGGPPGMGSGPMSITAGPDGAMWFVEAGADQVGRITADGKITEFPLPRRERMHAHPTAIVAGPDGAVWFSEPLVGALARIDVRTHAITEFGMRRTGGGGGLVGGNSLAAGPGGALWYENPGESAIGRMSTSGQVHSFPLENSLWRPASVASGPDGNVWFLESFDGKVIRMTLDGRFTEWAAPAEAAGIGHGSPTQMVAGSEGALWFAAPAGNRIGLIVCGA
jgi:virginiamycin B lyase